jgi:coenzyme PQQ synthesis protein D (PqqD)
VPSVAEQTYVLSQSKDVLSTQVDQEMALMSVARGRYYRLNAVASDIWKRLERPTRLNELRDALRKDYRGNMEQIRADLNKVIGQLLEEGLLTSSTRCE